MTFDSLGLSAPILQAVSEEGYTSPTPIQAQAIPPVLQGRDVMAAAQTGTGKTAGFTLPLLSLLSAGANAATNKVRPNQVRALVLTPTRELAAQVGDSVATYGKHLPLRSTVVFGGVKINPQMMALRKGVDILVATPGRLLDLYGQNAVKFDQLEILVLDEADRMLDMGFIHDIRRIMAVLPKKRQNLMFSATFSDDIRKLAKSIVTDPVEVTVNPPNSTAQRVRQTVYPVDKKQKPALLTELIKENNWQQVLVFTRTKHGANKLVRQLEESQIKALAIHGNKSQAARTKALAQFKDGKIRILVATDIAARGLDIDQLPQVVNFDLPQVAEDYVHRIGRTGRAGAEGDAVSLVAADEVKQLADIEKLIKQKIKRVLKDGFEPDHTVPDTPSNPAPAKPRRPKKPKKPGENGERAGGQPGRKPAGKPAGRPADKSAPDRARRPQNGNAPKGADDKGGNAPGQRRRRRGNRGGAQAAKQQSRR